MQKPNKHTFPHNQYASLKIKMLFTAIFFLVSTLLMQACKKDLVDNISTNDPIQLAKNALRTAEKKQSFNTVNMSYRQRLDRKISWDKATFKKYGDTTAVYAPITLSQELTIKSGGKAGISINKISWLIITNVSGVYKYYMVMKVPDQEMKESDSFKGTMIIDDWFGSKESVYIKKGYGNQILQSSNGTTTMALECTTLMYDICAGETGACEHHADTTCKRVEDNYAEDATEQPWDTISSGSGGGSDNDNNNNNKDNKPKIEIIKTDLTEKFPCATLLVIDKLESIPAYNRMVTPFVTLNMKPNLTWKVSDQPWQDGKYSAGNTGISEDSRRNASSDINLNSHLLQKGSQLLIAATAIHETYHAYVNYMFAYEQRPDLVDKSSPSYMAGIVQYILYTKNPGTDLSDHYSIINSQFDNMVSILYAYGNQKYSEQDCRMALLFGLDNAGENSSNGEKAFIKQSYERLMGKYGFTEQSVKKFTLEQINPTNDKKLPNNCN